MLKYFCDRCGKEIPAEHLILLEIRNGDDEKNWGITICRDCCKSLKQWRENPNESH